MKKSRLKNQILAGLLCATLVFQNVSITAFATEDKGQETESQVQTENSQTESEETDVINVTEVENEVQKTEDSVSTDEMETEVATEKESEQITETEIEHETGEVTETEIVTEQITETQSEESTEQVTGTQSDENTEQIAETQSEENTETEIVTEAETAMETVIEEETEEITETESIIETSELDEIEAMYMPEEIPEETEDIVADKPIFIDNLKGNEDKWFVFTAEENALYHVTTQTVGNNWVYKRANVYVSDGTQLNFAYEIGEVLDEVDIVFIAQKGETYYIRFTATEDIDSSKSFNLMVNTLVDKNKFSDAVTVESTMTGITYEIDFSDVIYSYTRDEVCAKVSIAKANSSSSDIDFISFYYYDTIGSGNCGDGLSQKLDYEITFTLLTYNEYTETYDEFSIQKVIRLKEPKPNQFKKLSIGDYTLHVAIEPMFGGFRMVQKVDVPKNASSVVDLFCMYRKGSVK